MNILNLIFACLITITLTSCSNTVDQNIEYYNPVEGEWNVYTDSGTILHKKIYTTNFDSYFLIIDGSLVSTPEVQHYYISGNNKLVYNRYEQIFKIEVDTLWITSSDGNKISHYIRDKSYLIE